MRIRSYDAAGIAVAALCVAAFAAWQYRAGDLTQPSLEGFTAAYDRDIGVDEQQEIAARYLRWFTADQLSGALEREHPGLQCHKQAHGLGRAVYAREKNLSSAIGVCGDSCNYGCFHGAIMGLFSTESDTLGGAIEDEGVDSYVQHIAKKAKELCSDPDVARVVQPTFCTHGLGHVFMYATNMDLSKSIELCGVFADSVGVQTCAGGVFMEYALNTNVRLDSGRSWFSICDAYPDFGRQCYRFMASRAVPLLGGSKPALAYCASLPERARHDCAFGVGYAQLRQSDFSRADGPARVCGSLAEPEDVEECIEGGIVQLTTSTGAITPRGTCSMVDAKYRDECFARLQWQQQKKDESSRGLPERAFHWSESTPRWRMDVSYTHPMRYAWWI